MIVRPVMPRIRGKPHQNREIKRLSIQESRRVAMSNKQRMRQSEAPPERAVRFQAEQAQYWFFRFRGLLLLQPEVCIEGQ